MAQGPSDTIFVAIQITLWIQESKVRNPDPPDYSKNCHAVFGGGLFSLSASSHFLYALSLYLFLHCLILLHLIICSHIN